MRSIRVQYRTVQYEYSTGTAGPQAAQAGQRGSGGLSWLGSPAWAPPRRPDPMLACDPRSAQPSTSHKCYLFLDVLLVRGLLFRGLLFCLSGFRGLPQDVAVPSRFRRRESVEKIQI